MYIEKEERDKRMGERERGRETGEREKERCETSSREHEDVAKGKIFRSISR